jgi:hypothetical protein
MVSAAEPLKMNFFEDLLVLETWPLHLLASENARTQK